MMSMIKRILDSIMKKKLLFLMISFCVLVVGITLGSAILTKTLSIGGKTKINSCNWDIHFEDIVINPNSVKNTDTSKDAKIIGTDKQNITFSTNLSSVGDFYEFDVYTVNDSGCDMDAMIDSVELEGLTDEQKKYISYSIQYDDSNITSSDTYYSNKYDSNNNDINPYSREDTNLLKCDRLFALTRRKIKVRVTLRKEITTDSLELSFNFKINYVQPADNCGNVPPIKNVLTIDPNGGTYNNSSEKTDITLKPGKDYEVLTPIHDSYTFMYWEVVTPEENGTYSFENNKYFRMGNENVEIRAKWDQNYVASIGMCNFYSSVQDAFNAMKDGYTISEDLAGKKIYNNYRCNPNDKTVYLLKDHTENSKNESSDAYKFNLLGHTLTGTITNGDDDNNNVNLTLLNGKIISPSNKNEAVTNYGTLTMGENDDVVNVENSISIVGNINGIVNKENAIMYFYDGYVDSIEKNGVSGDPIVVDLYDCDNDAQRVFTPDNYHIMIDGIENGTRAYLILNPNRAVAKITTGYERYYYNLQEAFNRSMESKRNTYCNSGSGNTGNNNTNVNQLNYLKLHMI